MSVQCTVVGSSEAPQPQPLVESIPTSEEEIWNEPTTTSPLVAPQSFLSSARPRTTSSSLASRLKDRLARAHPGMKRPRRPCGYVFQRGDIAWNCRTCQTDATCVICDECFRNSNHEGHEVYFHRTSPGGCCDCGDVEAWNIHGCCPTHQPELTTTAQETTTMESSTTTWNSVDPTNPTTSTPSTPSVVSMAADPLEAVRTALKGYELQQETLGQAPTALPPATTAALATVIGAAVSCLVQAVQGAGVGADPLQFPTAWPLEASLLSGDPAEEFAAGHLPLPPNYQLQLRLHNDDVHTFEEVIDALHQPTNTTGAAAAGAFGAPPPNNRGGGGPPGLSRHGGGPDRIRPGTAAPAPPREPPSLVPLREQATEMTHHVDADGQVVVKTYDNCRLAVHGFGRLKVRGLQCAVVSTAQVDLEQRARHLAVWLTEVCAAHPVAAALCIHALVQIDDTEPLAGYYVWSEPRTIPPWVGSAQFEQDAVAACRHRLQVFAPHKASSYLTRLEAWKLHDVAKGLPGFAAWTRADVQYYQGHGSWRRLALQRHGKSPHALWGTLPSRYHPRADQHDLLRHLTSSDGKPPAQPDTGMHLVEPLYVVDTDLRKQQEADRISSSVYPHKLPGLHLVWKPLGLSSSSTNNEPEEPNPQQVRHLLAMSSYRAPVSSILWLLLLDPYPTKQLRGATHALFLSLLTDSRFKCRFAAAFGVAYRPLSTLFCAGVGTEADTPLHFAVQILTAGSLVRALGHLPATQHLLLSDSAPSRQNDDAHNHQSSSSLGVFCLPIAHTIARCIHTNLLGATKEVNMILTNAFRTHRRSRRRQRQRLHQQPHERTRGTAHPDALHDEAGDHDDDDDLMEEEEEDVLLEEEDYDDTTAAHTASSNATLLPALTYIAGEHPLVTLLPAAPDDGFLDSRSTRHKRLPHLLRDLEYVMETPGTALRLLLYSQFPVYQGQTPLSLRNSSTSNSSGGGSSPDDVLVFPTVFARLLRLAQGMDAQKRKISGGHVEYEQNRWLEAFGLSLNIASARDALAESPAKTDAVVVDGRNSQQQQQETLLAAFRQAMGNLNAALLREIKLWLYREGLLETGLPIPSGGGLHGPMDLAQAGALQRSTLHVTGSSSSTSSTSGDRPAMDTSPLAASSSAAAAPSSGSGSLAGSYLGGNSSSAGHHLFHHHSSNHNMVALSCATGVKMTEHQLGLIENALKAEGEMRLHRLSALGVAPTTTLGDCATGPSAGLVMGDWLRVPHSPLAGDSLSFHLPLHRALAKSIRSLCSVVMPDSIRDAHPHTWWKIPVLDDDATMENAASAPYASSFPMHPLVPLLKPTLRSSNCRVVWMMGPDCTPQEAQRRRARARNVSAHIAVTKVLHSLADHPIRCLAAAQQIERHLWARNGSPVTGMAMNYTSTPLCRSFRDLDLLLVQLSATGWNVGLGARRVFALLLSRFNMDGYLCDPERRYTGGPAAAASPPRASGSGSRANNNNNNNNNPNLSAATTSVMQQFHHGSGGIATNPNTFLWVNPPRLQDPDHAVVLSESFFSTLCVLVTELPPPPPRSASDNGPLRQSIRRELLHALASEPRSRSEAMAAAALGVMRRDESEGSSNGGAASGGGTGGGLFRATFAQVLDEIGQAKKTTGRSRGTPGAPPSFELSADSCEEYDPTFYHLRRQDHQHAMDIVARLRKVKFPNECLPLVCPPPKAHPRFLPCRLLLHLPALDASIRRALLFALTGGSWLPPMEPVQVPQEDLKMSNTDGDAEDGDVILHDGLAAPANFSMTASGDVVITSFTGADTPGRPSLGPRRNATRSALASSNNPVSSFLRRPQSHEPHDPRGGKPFSKEVVAASAVSFLEVLQLLTLQAHTLEECASLHRTLPDLDEESRLISSGLSINTYLSRLVWVPESIEDVWALRPSSRGGPLDSKGSGECRGSVLGLLIALYEHRSDHSGGTSGGGSGGDDSDDNAGGANLMDEGHHGGARQLGAHGLKWLLRFVRALVDGATSVTAAAKSATSGVPIAIALQSSSSKNSSPQSGSSVSKLSATDGSSSYTPGAATSAGWTIHEGVRTTIQGMLDNLPDLWPLEKNKQTAGDGSGDNSAMSANQRNKEAGKEAQRRVMELMMQKQRKFAATIDDGKGSSDNVSSGVGVEECIICRCDDADGEINGPLGYLGHVQRSRVSQMRSSLEAEMADTDSENGSGNSRAAILTKTFRVIGHMGCQLRETEALDSKPLMCLPRGSVVTVLKRAFSAEYGILSRRVLVRHVKKADNNACPVISEGWASVMSSQGYVILSPLGSLCYSNSKWGATRPIVMQCGHAAHLKCVETHTLSLHQRAAGEQPYDGRFAANIADGEFLCPLCKQLSNILIPRDVPPSGTKETLPGAEASIQAYDKMDVDQEGSSSNLGESSGLVSSNRVREIGEIFHVSRLANPKPEDLNDLRVKALEDFGSHLYQAMEVSWDRTMNNRKKQQRWHPAIRKWDYEEEGGSGGGSMGLPRLLREQLIAWSAIGHSASSAEAGARGVEEVLPFGISSQTSDPWNGFTKSSFRTHAMIRELKRTLSGASGLLELLCSKMTNRLSVYTEEEEPQRNREGETPVILHCLGNLLQGRSWIVSTALATANSVTGPDSANDLALWTELTALTAALPCHTARDGVLSLRCEARATAASMWATNGGASSSNNSNSSNNAALPLAVRNVLTSATPHIRMPESWGSTDPCVTVSQSTNSTMKPFRLGIACGYLYTPLLAWDLNTFTGAVFSALLLHDVDKLPNNQELLQIVQMLLCARIVQAISIPGGFEVPDKDDLDDEDECWTTADEVQSQGTALSRLVAHCHEAVSKSTRCLDANTELLGSTNTDTSNSPLQLLAGVSRAILPFARSLVLMTRATVAVRQDRLERANVNKNDEQTEADQVLEAALFDSDLMECEDGFMFVKALKGPLPLQMVPGDVSNEWFELTNRWLTSLIGFEIHQGSSGRSLLPLIADKLDAGEVARQLAEDRSGASPKDSASNRVRDQEGVNEGNVDEVMQEAPPVGGEGVEVNANEGGFVVVRRGTRVEVMVDDVEDHDDADEIVDEVDMDDAEEMVDFANTLGFGEAIGVAGPSMNSGQDDSHESSDENSESGSDDGFENFAEFANVSRSPIIPYQPSFLALDQIGPGRHGAMFEYGEASSVMSDLSHLSMIHRKHVPTFNLIRLPKSFVELYNIVSKVKGREESGGTDEHEDVGNTETAICLLTGTVMRSGSPRRSYSRSIRPPGACTLHARKHGSGIGIYFLVQKCTVLLMHNNKSAYSPSIYVDEHGEEDPGLRRGRPLFLNDVRYRALEMLWRNQGIPREVAQIRSTSDRVIRDNWY